MLSVPTIRRGAPAPTARRRRALPTGCLVINRCGAVRKAHWSSWRARVPAAPGRPRRQPDLTLAVW